MRATIFPYKNESNYFANKFYNVKDLDSDKLSVLLLEKIQMYCSKRDINFLIIMRLIIKFL